MAQTHTRTSLSLFAVRSVLALMLVYRNRTISKLDPEREDMGNCHAFVFCPHSLCLPEVVAEPLHRYLAGTYISHTLLLFIHGVVRCTRADTSSHVLTQQYVFISLPPSAYCARSKPALLAMKASTFAV